MKHIILSLVLSLLFTTTANAQSFGWRHLWYGQQGCQNGQCRLQTATCENGKCNTKRADEEIAWSCAKGQITCVGCKRHLLFTTNRGDYAFHCPQCKQVYSWKGGKVFIHKTTLSNGETVPGVSQAKVEQTEQTLRENVAKRVANLLASANAVRARFGLPALSLDTGLEQGAARQTKICASSGTLIHGYGVAEILAQNSQGFETALNQWLNSPGHRALLLSPNFRVAGASIYRDSYGRVWCAMQFK